MPKNKSAAFSARKRLIAVAIAACFTTAPAWSNPTGPQVVNGSATFAQTPKLLTVTNSNGAIINWNKFSIGANETTRFNQASANSSVLNRVLANDPSVLLGALSSNGRVWLVNPAGIMVGQGARIDVAAFVASTLNVRNEDFLAGRLNFGATPNAGKIENRGQITTPSGGSVYLVAPAVKNHGIINAPNGEVILAAGQTAQLIDTGTPGVKVDITGAEGNVTNLGAIVAEAGRIGLAGVLVKNSGTLNASSLVKEGGRIFLKASGDAYVDGAGRIDATGTKGGSIEVLGNRVAVMDQARLDASGDTGGGTVLVGGDYQGKNPGVQNAAITYFGPDASIKADAARTGDGGKAIVWANDTTRAYGNISARGGADGGNGGFVETSGKRYLDVSGIQVDARGVRGRSGTWLLDPNDISVINGDGGEGQPLNGKFEFDTTSPTPATSTITDGTINATLNAGTNVKLKTSSAATGGNGDILMAGDAAISTFSSERQLELEADHNINLQGSIGTTSIGSLIVQLTPGNGGKVTTGLGQTLTLNGAGGPLELRILNGKTWENDGTVNLNGNSSIGVLAALFNYATFWNKPAGIVNIDSTHGRAFTTGDPSQGGIINNDGTINVLQGTAFEAEYSQSGTLNIPDSISTNFLHLQNAISLSGSVDLGTSGLLNINEDHGKPASLTNLGFPGSGGILNVTGGKTVNFSEVDARHVALHVGPSDAASIVNVVNGHAVFKSLTTFGSGRLDAIENGTLGITSGDFVVPIGVHYAGDVGYFASGNLTVNDSITVLPGTLKLIAGWDGNIATPGTTVATGTVAISGFSAMPAIVTAGNISINAGSSVAIGNNFLGTAALSSPGSIRIRTGSGGLAISTGSSFAASGDVELAPSGNLDMCIVFGSPCAEAFSLDPSILSRVSASGALILGRAVTDTSYTGTLSVKAGTTIPSSFVHASKLALNGYDVTIEPGASIGDSAIGLSKPLDILANRHLTVDGEIFLASGQNLLMKAGQFDGGSLTVEGTAIAGGSIALNNPRGDVTGSGSLQTPGTLSVDANGGISLAGSNRVGTFVATNAGSGDIEFYNTGNFNLGSVTNFAPNALIDIFSGNSGSITQTGDLTTLGGPITVIADTDLTMGSGTRAQSAGGTITYAASRGSVRLGLLDAGAGDVFVVAGENITDANGVSTNNIKASFASLIASDADAGPGSIDVDTQVPNLFVNNSLVYSTPAQPNNSLTVRNSDSPLAVTVLSASDTGQLTITNDNTINVGHIGGATNTTITATGTSSDISVAQGLNTLLAAGDIALNAGRDILVTHDFVDAGGSVTATAGKDIRISSTALLTASAGAYIKAANGINLTMQTGGLFIDGSASSPANITATSGNINVTTSTGFKNGSVSGFGTPDALSAPLGRWLVYAPNPASVIKNGLASDFRHYNAIFGNYSPGSVTESGNGFIYASAAGNLTVTTNLASGTAANTYGVAPTASFGFTLAGFADSEDNLGNIGLAGTAAFAPTLAANTNAGSYTVAYANGLTSGVGYGFSAGSGVAYTVNRASLTLAAVTDTKVYNGTTASSLSPTITGLVSGDSVTGLSQSFGSIHALGLGASTLLVDVGSGRNVVNDGNGGNNYIVSTLATHGTITPAPLSASLINTGVTKPYDGTSAAPVGFTPLLLVSGLVSGDGAPTFSATSFGYNSAHVAGANKVTVAGLTLTGISGSVGSAPGDYSLPASVDVAASITPKALTASLANTGVTKTYDGTAAAPVGFTPIFSVSGLVSGDSAAALASAGSGYNSAHVAAANKVTVTGLSLSGITGTLGSATSDYSIAASADVVASITPAQLTASLTNTGVTKTYDGTSAAPAGFAPAFSVSGLVSGDSAATIGNTGSTYNSAHVASATTVTVSGPTLTGITGANASLASDYSLTVTNPGVAATITPAPLTVSAIGQNKVYDGTSNATVSLGDNRFGSDVLTLAYGSAAFNDKNAGAAKPVNVSGLTLTGADSGDYRLSSSTLATTANITVRPLATWTGGATGNWSLASNWDALPDLSNVLAVSVPAGNSVTYDAAAGSTNLASLTAAGLSIAGGNLTIANSLTVSSSFSQSGGTLVFGGGASANITQASGNLNLPAFAVANLSLKAPAGAITQSGRIAALTLNTQSQGATTLDNPDNQISGRVDMTAGGPLKLRASGDLILGGINAGANPVEIKAGAAILKAPGTETSTNIIGSAADLTSVFGGAAGDLAISADTQVTGALTATVGAEADHGGIRIKNSGAQPLSVTLTDNALAGASVSFLNTENITSSSGYTLKTLKGGDLALLSNGNITWDGGSLVTPSGGVLMSADGNIAVTGALSSPVDLALSSKIGINVSGSVSTGGTGTAAFTAPNVAINGSVNAADDVGIITGTLSLGAGSRTGAGHDVIIAAANVVAANAGVSAVHDISAAVTGDLRLNGSGFTAGNDIFLNLLGATSTLYLNDAAGLPPAFLWAQAPSTIHLDFPARTTGGMVVDGVAADPRTFTAATGASGLFNGATRAPATFGAGLDLVYSDGTAGLDTTTAATTVANTVIVAISASTTQLAGAPPSTTLNPNQGPPGGPGVKSGADQIGGTEDTFGGSSSAKKDEDKDKKDADTGLKKQADKPTAKKLATCS